MPKKTKKTDKELFAEFPNMYKDISGDELDACMAYAKEYMSFLDISKTEREFVENTIEAAKELGFKDIAVK